MKVRWTGYFKGPQSVILFSWAYLACDCWHVFGLNKTVDKIWTCNSCEEFGVRCVFLMSIVFVFVLVLFFVFLISISFNPFFCSPWRDARGGPGDSRQEPVLPSVDPFLFCCCLPSLLPQTLHSPFSLTFFPSWFWSVGSICVRQKNAGNCVPMFTLYYYCVPLFTLYYYFQ